MGEILPRHYIIGIVIFTLVIVSGTSFLAIMAQDNPAFANDLKYSQFNSSFDKMSDITTEVGELEDTVENADATEFGELGVLNSLIKSSWQSLRLLGSSLSFMDDAFDGLTDIFGVPAWVSILIGLIVTVIIVFAILSAIFQRDI